MTSRSVHWQSFGATPLRMHNISLMEKLAQISDKFYYKRIKKINILPDDVLLEIFNFCQLESNSHITSFRPGSYWLILVHVCQRWRRIVLVSPRRLDLTLFCTYGTPVRKHLGFLPPFPIVVDYLTFANFRSPAPDYKDDIIAALEHPDRVRTIKLAVTNSLLAMVAPVMQEPFTALTTLWLSSKDRNAPVIPDVFLSGPAPHLLKTFLEGISFPTLPTLLSSASNLVDLQLKDIPQSGYVSPGVMVTSLALLNRLDTLFICFKEPRSLQLRSSPVMARHVLLSLVTFNFCGSSEYLEHLLAQIDTPRLRVIDITYFNQLDFQVPQLSQFIRRTEHLELPQSRHSRGRICINSTYVKLGFKEGHRRSGFTLRISCKWPDWQVLHLAQILGQSPSMVSNVEHLSIDDNDLQIEPGWKDSIDDTDWLELLLPFTAVKKLHGSKQLAGHIALALDGPGGEMNTEVLPALISLLLEDQPVRSVEKFLAAREISGHPVTFVDPAPGSATPWEHHDPAGLLVDGLIARTFASEDANRYLKLLLPEPPSEHFLQYYGISPTKVDDVPLQTASLLDYSVTEYGTVVPQKRWSLADEVDVRRHVQSPMLQLPIFFVNRNGELGFPLSDIIRGCDRDLRNANDVAQLGGKIPTHIRINWPGYMPWKRQIPNRDETHARNPITVGRFMRHVGRCVDIFLRTKECMSSDDVGFVDLQWKIGAGRITRDGVIVIGAISVSVGSWMPILQLNR